MAGFIAGSRLHEYFDSTNHSDVLISLSSQGINAHKLILSQASDYFRAVFEGQFREASSTALKLYEDDPRTVKGMIGWIYGLHFDGKSDYVRVKPHITRSLAGYDYVTYSVDLYVTASKYLVTSLQNFIIADFRKNLAVLAPTTGFSHYVDHIAKQVYLRHREAARPLRTHVLGVVAATFDGLEGGRDTDSFKMLMREVPELSWDLLLKLGRDNEEWRMLASQDG